MPKISDVADEAAREPAPTPTPAPKVVAPSALDALVDRWFGDFGIPNHFIAAREDLKRRLAAFRA